MKTESKGNNFLFKLLASVIIIVLFTVCFCCFIFIFNRLYQLNPADMGIVLRHSTVDVATNFFFLFGFIASLGSLVRIIFDFIGHTCYTKEFDFKIWWPWYFFRPLLSFILGAFFVIFFDNSLFGDEVTNIPKSPFIFAFITGFSVTDAITFLRQVSKRIFGAN